MSNVKTSDLLKEAEQAGLVQTEWIREQITDAFNDWLDSKEIYTITEEEYEMLRTRFCDGLNQAIQHW